MPGVIVHYIIIGVVVVVPVSETGWSEVNCWLPGWVYQISKSLTESRDVYVKKCLIGGRVVRFAQFVVEDKPLGIKVPFAVHWFEPG